MFDIVKLLNDATAPEQTSKEYRALQEQCSPYWDAVEKAFSTRFVNEMFSALCAVNIQECGEYFRRGLWLGLRIGQFSEQGPGGGVGDLDIHIPSH